MSSDIIGRHRAEAQKTRRKVDTAKLLKKFQSISNDQKHSINSWASVEARLNTLN